MISAWPYFIGPLLLIAILIGIPLSESLARRRARLKLIRSGRSIEWTGALGRIRLGDGLIVENHTTIAYGHLWWVPVPEKVEQYWRFSLEEILDSNKEPKVTSSDPRADDYWLYHRFASTGLLITSISAKQAKETLLAEGLITRWRKLECAFLDAHN